MPDREAILRALHCRGQDLMIDAPACDQCEYRFQMPNRGGCDFRRLCRDAAAVMAEPDAVKPKTVNNGEPEPGTTWWYVCGNCGLEIEYDDRFCRWCGKAVKWE